MAVVNEGIFTEKEIEAPERSIHNTLNNNGIDNNMIGSDDATVVLAKTPARSEVPCEVSNEIINAKAAPEDGKGESAVLNGESDTNQQKPAISQVQNLNENLLIKNDLLGSLNLIDAAPAPLLPGTDWDQGSSVDLGESEGESESESELNDEVKCCPHAHQFVNDLSEEASSAGEAQDIKELRKERRQKKSRKRKQRLKKCCSGCDGQESVEPLTSELPSPIGLSTGMLQCNVIKSFEEVVSTRYNSEEEIDAAINSYSTVGGRLANQNEQTFSDVDIAGYKSRSDCGSPASDPDLLVCDYSNSVGRKLANRNLNNQNDNLDECIGGFLLDTLNQNLDPTSRLFAMEVEELNTMVKGLHLKLQNVSEDLVNVVTENDDLKAQKSVITKHVTQLSRLAQGFRANDNSAFRKILVTRETDI